MRLLRRTRGPMTCAEVARHLQGYLDGNLDDGRAQRLAAHLEMCRDCGMEAETYLDIRAALATHGTGPLPGDALARLADFARRLADEHE